MWAGQHPSHDARTHLDVARPSPAALPVLGQVFHQHGGEDSHPSVQLPLPESVVRLSVAAQQANHRPLRKGELLVGLALVIIKCTDVRHCRQAERQRERERKANDKFKEAITIVQECSSLSAPVVIKRMAHCWRDRDKEKPERYKSPNYLVL